MLDGVGKRPDMDLKVLMKKLNDNKMGVYFGGIVPRISFVESDKVCNLIG